MAKKDHYEKSRGDWKNYSDLPPGPICMKSTLGVSLTGGWRTVKPDAHLVHQLAHLPGVPAHRLADQGDFVGEGDLHIPVGVLSGLYQLGGDAVGGVEVGFDDEVV